jgi:hypothetical protein
MRTEHDTGSHASQDQIPSEVVRPKASKAQRVGSGLGLFIGIIAASLFPKGGNLVAAFVIGAVCGSLGASLGQAVGSFINTLLEGPPTDDEVLDSSALTPVSLVLGLLGLVAWILPIIGLPVGALGYFLGRKGTSTRQRNVALIGMGLSLLCLLLSAINGYVGALLSVMGQL